VGKHSPTRFDALKLAARGGCLAGEVDAVRLPRLADRVVQPPDADSDRIEWRIFGGLDAQRSPILTLSLEGRLFLICQRCLGPLRVPVAQRTELLLARDEAELARLDVDEREVILATAPLDALTLVEDELLLSLPFAPRHEQDTCVAAASPASALQEASSDETSPFARLAGLKTGSRSRA
jgi:uncharacterized protein